MERDSAASAAGVSELGGARFDIGHDHIEAGSFIGLRSGRMAILCGNGTVYAIDQVQPRRGEPMSARSLVRERKLKVGDVVV